jgi:hypothetical protein
MTNWHLGQYDEARQLIAETLPAVEKELQSPATRFVRRTSLELLLAEAEALIGSTEADGAVEIQTNDE